MKEGYLGLEPNHAKSRRLAGVYEHKIHMGQYECWVAAYYDDGTFPTNDALQAEYQRRCDDASTGERLD